jgi:peroxisomal 3,2-trans-enoyl-CoA isomerase
MEYKTLKVEVKNGICEMAFNRPNKFNSFSFEMFLETTDLLNKIAKDENIKILSITGEGSYFSSGNDLNNFTSGLKKGNIIEATKEAGELCYNFVNAFIDFPKCIIVGVNGPAIGILYLICRNWVSIF